MKIRPGEKFTDLEFACDFELNTDSEASAV